MIKIKYFLKEVQMKTKTNKLLLIGLGFLTASCSSSLQVSNSSSWGDEIYGTTTVKKVETPVATNEPTKTENPNYKKLDDKFAEALKVAQDTTSKNDTVVYKAENNNPYDRILSDSYQESYERRLRGFEDPRYGIENWTTYYSDDYWYAQAYDPSFYRIVVMGGQVWVEPWYIYNMFSWPRTSLWIGWNWGYYNPWYYNSWYPNYWNPYYGWGANYTYPYYYNTPTNYYGRRNSISGNQTATYRTINPVATANTRNTQTVVSRNRYSTNSTNSIRTTRDAQTRITPTYENRQTTEGRNTVINNRTTRPSRNIGISEPTRRSGTTTYTRTRTNSSTDFNNTRRTTNPTYNTTSTRTNNSVTRPRSTTTPIYNRPNRSSTTSQTRGTESNRNESYTRSSSRTSTSSSSRSSSSASRSTSSSSNTSSSNRRK